MYNLEFRKKREKKIKHMYNMATIVISVLIILAVVFIRHILVQESIAVQEYMIQSSQQTASNLSARVVNSINEMKILSLKFQNDVDISSEYEITAFLKRHINDYDYQRLIFAYPDGRTVRYQRYDGKLSSTNWLDEPKFLDALQGREIFAHTSKNAQAPSGYVNEFAVPVYDDNKNIVGVLASQVYANKYLKILGFNNYSEKGFAYIVDLNGNYIVKSPRDVFGYDNFLDMDIKYIGVKKDEVQNSLKFKKEISFICKYKFKKYIFTLIPIKERDSSVLVVVPVNVLMLHVDSLLLGIITIIACISLLVIWLINYSHKLFDEEEKFIYNIAFVDKITGGANKNQFVIRAKSILNDWMSEHKDNYAMIAIDIATFKAIGELYGLKRSNKILKDVYNIIKDNITERSICSRDYDSKFLVLYKYEKESDIVEKFINKILAELEIYNENYMTQFFSESGTTISSKIALFFGIYIIKDLSYTVDQMCENAYMAKKSIKGNVLNLYKFYDDNFRIQRLQNKVIEDEMFEALKEHQFKMYLQPKFDLKTLKVVGAEALVRWVHPRKGIIAPVNYIPLFEQNGFILELDKCIWRQACEFLSERKKTYKKMFPISVNVSRIHMNDDLFVEELISLVKEYEIEPGYLELEVTESACFENEARFKEILAKLNQNGFTISVDDFGTGYSSLNMLRELPVNVLKIDRGFIKDTISDKRGQIIVRNIVNMAKELNMATVVEGIETEEQAEFLRNIGCDIAQGFLYGKPSDLKTFTEQFLKEADPEIYYKN